MNSLRSTHNGNTVPFFGAWTAPKRCRTTQFYASNIGLVLLSMFLFVVVTYTAFNLLTLLHYISAKLTIRLIHKRTRSQRRSLKFIS